jgi:hypothetical protein
MMTFLTNFYIIDIFFLKGFLSWRSRAGQMEPAKDKDRWSHLRPRIAGAAQGQESPMPPKDKTQR